MPRIHVSYFASTFQIITGGSQATCFIITLNGNQYLITAKHIFPTAVNGELKSFQLQLENTTESYDLNIFVSSILDVDIAVFKLPKHLIPVFDFKLRARIGVGEDVNFFGYPYGISSYSNNLNFKLALVKGAKLSGSRIVNDGSKILYLDGHNNPGFSGGMVGFYDSETNEECILSVISGYTPQTNTGNSTFGTFQYHENSGIIISYSSKHILDIIGENNI